MIFSKKQKLLIGLTVLLFFYAVAGFFFAPSVIRNKILEIVPAQTGREASLEVVSFNPFSMTLRLDDFQILEDDGSIFISVDTLLANLNIIPLLNNELSLAFVKLTNPKIQIKHQKDQSFNFDSILKHLEKNKKDTPETSKPEPTLHINQLLVRSGEIGFEDTHLKTTYRKHIRNIAFRINDFTTRPEEKGKFKIDAASGTRETFDLSGQIQLFPLLVDGQLTIANLHLPHLMPYTEGKSHAQVDSGNFSTNIHFTIQEEKKGINFIAENGEITIDTFSLSIPGDTEPFMVWDSFSIKDLNANSRNKETSIQTIALRTPKLFVFINNDGIFNFDRLKPTDNIKEDAPPSTYPLESPWILDISQLEITNASTHYLDYSLEQHANLTLTMPSLSLNKFSTRTNQQYNLSIAANWQNSGTININADGSLFPLTGNLNFTIDDLDLPTANPFINQLFHLSITKGKFNSNASISYSLSEDMIDYSGNTSIKGFQARGTQNNTALLSWTDFNINKIEYSKSNNTLSIDSIDILNSIQELIKSPDGSINISSLRKTSSGKTDAKKPTIPKATPLTISLRQLAITNGSYVFEDQSQSPKVRITANKTQATITDLSNDSQTPADIHFQTNIQDVTPFVISGKLNPLTHEAFTNVHIQMNGLEMTPFAPYFSRYAGHHLQQGILNLDLDYKINNRELEAENNVRLNQLTLGEKSESPDSLGLPLPLAISLLKDPQGNIDLSVPILGNIDDPEIRTGKIVWRVIGNLIVKMVASPFNLLANLVPVSADDLRHIAFAPGNSNLNATGMSHLDALAQVMQLRPGISIEITATIDAELELEPYQRHILEQQLLKTNNLSSEQLTAEIYQRLVEEKFKSSRPIIDALKDLPSFQEMEQSILKKTGITEDDLRDLLQARKQNVRNYLISEKSIAPERVLIIESVETADNEEEPTSRVRVQVK